MSENIIYIRVDANEFVASGHVMRCITIAKELRKKKIKVIFVSADQGAAKYINKEGFQVISLDSKYDDLEKEIDTFLNFLIKENAKIVLVDSYFVTELYLNKLSRHVKIIYFDDMDLFHYPVHLLIRYGLHGDDEIYINKQIRDDKKILQGMRYIPLREEFSTGQISLKEVSDIMITTGGGDSSTRELLLHSLLELPEWNRISIHVVCGALSTDIKLLKDIEKKHTNVIIHENVNKMADLMCKCDIAVSAGGTTVYELIACGLPVICFSMAENQVLFVSELVKGNYIRYAGDITQDKCKVIQNIVSDLEELRLKTEKRKQLHDHCCGLVDGYGAKRIAEEIENII